MDDTCIFNQSFLRKNECLTCKYKYANIILIFDNMQIFANTVSNARRSYLDLNMNNDKCQKINAEVVGKTVTKKGKVTKLYQGSIIEYTV